MAYSSFLVSHTVEMALTEYYVLIEENSPSSFRVQHLNSTKRLYKPGANKVEANKVFGYLIVSTGRNNIIAHDKRTGNKNKL